MTDLKKEKEIKELVGKTVGNWTIIRRVDKRYVECRCCCGRIRIKTNSSIRLGYGKSCGCGGSILPGTKNGMLTIIKQTEKIRDKRFLWECKCDCGRTIYLKSQLAKTQKSCGCIMFGKNHHAWKGYGVIPQEFFHRLEKNAKERGIKFDLDKKYLHNLFISQNGVCSISGIQLSFNRNNLTASLDRIDSNKPYIKDNVQWVHKNINMMKWRYSQDEFISFCSKVSKYSKELETKNHILVTNLKLNYEMQRLYDIYNND